MYVGNSEQLGGIADFFTTVTKGINTVTAPVNAAVQSVANTALQYQQLKSVLRGETPVNYYPVMTAQQNVSTQSALRSVETPLSKAEIKNLQTGLKNLGIDPGPLDGIYGPKTAAAIKTFQSRNYLNADGKLSRWLYDMVLATATQSGGVPVAQPVQSAPPVQYQAGSTGERFAPGTSQIIPPTETPLSQTEIRTLQSALAKMGIDPGPIDGIFGPKTSAAIQQFQSRSYMAADGKLSRTVYLMATSAASAMPSGPVYTPSPSYPVPSQPAAPAPAAGGVGDLSKWAIPVGAALLGGILIVSTRRGR